MIWVKNTVINKRKGARYFIYLLHSFCPSLHDKRERQNIESSLNQLQAHSNSQISICDQIKHQGDDKNHVEIKEYWGEIDVKTDQKMLTLSINLHPWTLL